MSQSITPINVASVVAGQTLGPFDISQQYIKPTPEQLAQHLNPTLVLLNDTGVQCQLVLGGGDQLELPPGGWTEPIPLTDSDTTFKLFVRAVIPNQVITQITGVVYAAWEYPTSVKPLGNSPVGLSASNLNVTATGTVSIAGGSSVSITGPVTISGNVSVIPTNGIANTTQQRVVSVPVGVQQFWSGNWGPTVAVPTFDILRPLLFTANLNNNRVSMYFYSGQMSFVLTSGGAMEFKLSAQCEDISNNKLGSPVELWHSICSYSSSPLNQVISTFCPANPLCFTLIGLPANSHHVAFFLTAINGTFPGTLAGTIACDIDTANNFPNPDIGNYNAYGGIANTLF